MKKFKLLLKAIWHVIREPLIGALLLGVAILLVVVIGGFITAIPNVKTILLWLYLFLIAAGVLLYVITTILMIADEYKALSKRGRD
jgi:hypothetical protein